MLRLEISVDFNGLVLFEPALLREFHGGAIAPGTDLFTRYTTTEEGDAVLSAGLVVPILSIDDAGYTVFVRHSSEGTGFSGKPLVENGIFPFRVRERAVVGDLAVLKEWIEDLGWQDAGLPQGNYAVTVHGYREFNEARTKIVNAGYEFIVDPRISLPALTADLSKNMRVLRFDS
jgi:hypothetical protein